MEKNKDIDDRNPVLNRINTAKASCLKTIIQKSSGIQGPMKRQTMFRVKRGP